MKTEFENGPTDTSVKSALGLALAKTEPVLWIRTQIFWQRLREGSRPPHGQQPPELIYGGRMLDLPHEERTVQAFLDVGALNAPFYKDWEEICPDDKRAKLKDIQDREDGLIGMYEQFSPSNVNTKMNEQRDAYHAALAAGENVDAQVVESRETISTRFRTAQSGLTAALLSITHNELVPVAKPILERFAKLLERLMTEQEQIDLDTAAAYSLDYKPSLLWVAAATIATKYVGGRRLPYAHAWTTPKNLLAGLVEL